MAGLFAWAADVVGGAGQHSDEDENNAIPVIFTPEQQKYAIELDHKASTLSRSIQDLRLRIPPPDISQRLPHLHAHSLASNAALALQLNAHSATKEQAQLREITLQEENAAYGVAISKCESKIKEKLQEADLLQMKLKDLDAIEENLRAELESAQADISQSAHSDNLLINSKILVEEASEPALLDKLENKKRELSSTEVMIQGLEERWVKVQDDMLRQPSPAQREKMLDKQLHSLIEQLAAKQVQAEDLASEIHLKEKEFDRLNGLRRRLETGNVEASNARNRNRFGRSSSDKELAASDNYIIDPHHPKPPYIGGRTETQQRLMLLRSAFVLYILALHILVFIKISF